MPKVGRIARGGAGVLPRSWVTMRRAVGYMLETPSIRRYLSVLIWTSENPTGADNQQERLFTNG